MRTAPPLLTVALLIAGCHGSDAPPPQSPASAQATVPPVSATASQTSPVDRSTANAAQPAFPTNTAALPAQSMAAQQSTTATPAATRPLAATAVTIKSAAASIDAVLAGRKTSTTRKGTRSYPLGPAVLTDGRRRVPVTLTAVVAKTYADLTADDAASNGSSDLAAFRASLAHDYPGLAETDTVTVVHFARVGP